MFIPIALSVLFVWKVFLVLFLPQITRNDAFIIREISRSSDWFSLVAYEPHPPGMYFVLNQLQSVSDTSIFLLFAFVNLLLCIFVVSLLRKSSLSRYFSHALLLFGVTNAGILLSIDVKQDIVTSPLLFAIPFLLHEMYRNAGFFRKHIVWVNVILLFLLLFGYISYLWSMAFFGIFSILYLRAHNPSPLKKMLLMSIALQSSIAIGWFLFLGKDQLLINLGRFDWLSRQPNSLFGSLRGMLTSVNVATNESEILIFGFIFLIALGVYTFRKNIGYLFFLGCVLLISYGANLFSQPRYASLPLFLLTTFAIIGLEEIKKRTKLVPILVYILLFSYGMKGFIGGIWGQEHIEASLSTAVRESITHSRVGIISNSDSFPTIFKLDTFAKEKNVLAFRPLQPETVNEINGAFLLAPQKNNLAYRRVSETIHEQIKNYDIDEYYYVDFYPSQNRNQDIHWSIVNALTQYCSLSTLQYLAEPLGLYHFTKCHV